MKKSVLRNFTKFTGKHASDNPEVNTRNNFTGNISGI